MSANCLQTKFLESLTELLFPPHKPSEAQKLCFQLRFHPNNQYNKHSQIAAAIKKQLNDGFSENSIYPTIGNVVEKLKDNFAIQMQADGVKTEKLSPKGPGKPSNSEESPWRIVYKWLWETKFPHQGWKLSKEIAVCVTEQLQMKPSEDMRRDFNILDIPENCDNSIYIKQQYWLQIDLKQDGYLLLINQGVSGKKYIWCPSIAIAPSEKITPAIPIYLPQENALMKKPFSFNTVGNEYFLAIVTEKPLNLSWVGPDSAPGDITLDDERLHEIFKQLGQLSNCQLFDKTFSVIE